MNYDCINTDSSSDSSSDDSIAASDIKRQKHTVVVKGEIGYREKPPKDECKVLFPSDGKLLPIIGEVSHYTEKHKDECKILFPSDGKLLPIGQVSHYTEKQIVIQSFPNTPAVNEGTVIWKGDKTFIAHIIETFGPVKTPFYSILVQSKEHANVLGLTTGDTVYVVPGDLSLTMYVFTSKLLEQKGCDASWKNDVEMPDEYQQFSDDEQETSKKKNKKQGQKQISEKKGLSPQLSSGTYHRGGTSTYPLPAYSETQYRPPSQPLMYSPNHAILPPPYPPPFFGNTYSYSPPLPFFGHTYPYPPPPPPPPPGYHPWNRFPPPLI